MDKTEKSSFNLTYQHNIGAIVPTDVPTGSNLDASQARGIKREFSNVGHDIGSGRWSCELPSSSVPFKNRKIYNINDESDNDKKQSFDDMLNTLNSLIKTKLSKDEYSLYCQKIKDTENINIQLNINIQRNGNILHFALLKNTDDNIAEFLLKSDANIDINAKNLHGYTPLLLALQRRRLSQEIINLLLERGANINDKNEDGYTPLLLALLYNDGRSKEIIALLLKHGADINARNKYGYTPLLLALKDPPSKEIIALLLEHGADINAQNKYGDTPLLRALKIGSSQEIINLLLKHGANVNDKDENGDTPLPLELKRGRSQETINLLLEHGANVNDKDENGNTPLLLELKRGRSQETINLLLEHGANVNDKDENGNTPLLLELKQGRSQETINLLLEHGANVNDKDKDGNTPLLLALQRRRRRLSQKTIASLLEHGANVNDKDKDGNTPLLLALQRRGRLSQKTIASLLEHGADIYAENKYGDTPLLMLEIRQSSPKIIKFLHIYLEIELKKDTDVQELLSGFKSLYSILKQKINIDNLFEDHKKNKELLFIIAIIGEMKDPRNIEKFTEKFGVSPPKLDDFLSLQGQCAVVINRALQGRELGDYYPTSLKLFIKTYNFKEALKNFC